MEEKVDKKYSIAKDRKTDKGQWGLLTSKLDKSHLCQFIIDFTSTKKEFANFFRVV